MQEEIFRKLDGKKIAILGFGMEGKSTYKFIRKFSNCTLYILDQKDYSDDELIKDDSNIVVISDNYLSNLDSYDIIIKAPGVVLKDIDVTSFKDKITSQLELLMEVNRKNIIGVTGTKGKSTTTTLIYEMFKNCGYDAHLLGNIGTPIFDDIDNFKDDSILVIEMSALQLEFVNVSPHVAILLNLFEEHLDHAGSVEHYYENKLNIFKYQDKMDTGIYAYDNDNVRKYIDNNIYKQDMVSVSLKDNTHMHIRDNYIYYKNKKLYDITSKRNLIGDANLENIMFSLAVAEVYYLPLDKVIDTINNFKPLAHRLELVGEYNGITYYDDAIATIPEACINAIKSLIKVDTLILGGMDRGINYDKFIEYLKTNSITNLICMPETGYKIADSLMTSNKRIYKCETLEDAVSTAKKVTKKGYICLLSPAAASYNKYKNFIEKGNKFQELVKK